MHIGFITSVVSKRLGGIQNTSYYFAQYFNEKVDFDVFCSSESETQGLVCNISTTNCKSNDTLRFHFEQLRNLISSNKRKRYDFTFAALYPCALECLLLKKIHGVPYGVMMHGNELLDGVNEKSFIAKTKKKIRFFFRKMILDNADLLFANSEYTKELCMEKTSNNNICIIHPPVRFEDKKYEKTLKNNIVFSLGRLEKRKGFQFGIEAMETLIKEIPNLKYYIAGGGPYEETLKALIIEKQLQDNVVLLGRISEDEKDYYYRICDYFLMPSFIVEEESSVEGFGIVFVEANMYGKYVISTRSGGIPDAILEGETGEFVLTQDSSSIVTVMKRLYLSGFSYDPEKCIEWSKRMDVNNIVNQYIDVINRFVGC